MYSVTAADRQPTAVNFTRTKTSQTAASKRLAWSVATLPHSPAARLQNRQTQKTRHKGGSGICLLGSYERRKLMKLLCDVSKEVPRAAQDVCSDDTNGL